MIALPIQCPKCGSSNYYYSSCKECESVIDQIEQKAKELYWAQTLAWSGNKWHWSKASEEVKEKFRAHARAGTHPPLPEAI